MVGYSNQGSNIGKKIGMVVTAFIVAAVVKFGIGWGTGEYQRRTFDLDKAMAQLAITQPDIHAMFQKMKDSLPGEYVRFTGLLEQRVKAGASPDELKELGRSEMRAIIRRHRNELAKAPSLHLRRFRVSQIEIAQVLKAESDTLCAHFVMSGLLPGDKPSAQALPALAKAVQIQFDAIAAGARSNAKPPTTISDSDATAFITEMQDGGMTPAELMLVSTPQALGNAPVETQCRLGDSMLRAMDRLPTGPADRVTAFIISQA